MTSPRLFNRDELRLAGGLLPRGDAVSAPADEAMERATEAALRAYFDSIPAGLSERRIEAMRRAVVAALASLESSGWVCVPREATEASERSGRVDDDVNPREIYAAMLAAAPRLTGEKQ